MSHCPAVPTRRFAASRDGALSTRWSWSVPTLRLQAAVSSQVLTRVGLELDAQ